MQIGKQKYPHAEMKGGGVNAIKGIDYAHHEIHAGSSFSAWFHEDKSIGTNMDLLVVVPNTTAWPHMIFSVENESEADLLLYESVSNTSNGTVTTVYNNNRNKSLVTTAGVLVFSYPTAVTVGTTSIFGWHSGSGKGAGGSVRGEDEIILKQNTKYLLRITATAAGWLAAKLHWYEHTDV
jgi:hypothetical protein